MVLRTVFANFSILSNFADPPRWIYVQANTSTTPNSVGPHLDVTSVLDTDDLGTVSTTNVERPPPSPSHNLEGSSNKQHLKNKKRVRFSIEKDTDDCDVDADGLPTRTVPWQNCTGVCYSTLDLRTATGCLCDHFLNMSSNHSSDLTDSCLGYLEVERLHKLVFYNSRLQPFSLHTQVPTKVIQLSNILGSLDIFNQLKLALKVSQVVLSFHSTPWLSPYWRLHDLAFFGQLQPDVDFITVEQMKTLHLTAPIPNNMSSVVPRDKSFLGGQTSVVDHNEHTNNIRNVTLANLGIALLEIGLRKKIMPVPEIDGPEDIVKARKLADGYQAPLGPLYQRIVRKCLHCDFAMGADLKKKELQDAVYSDVICGIESLVKSCESLGLD
jgi:hypothetical protein